MSTTNATRLQGNDASADTTPPPLRRRRLGAHDRAVRGSGVALLASTGDLNFSVLNIEESYARLSHDQRLRLYYITRAIREAQKELFSSPEEELSPGELILELQKTCSGKGLTNAVSRFFKYVVLFYHNSGNYDLDTGIKFLPEMTQTEFEEVIQSSRAYVQRRGRVQRAREACLAAIFSSGEQHSTATAPNTTVGQNPGATTEATIVPMNEKLTYPFYGPGVSYMDAVRVDRTLDKHEILKINTRIIKVVDDVSDNAHATFHVFQASLSAEKKLDSKAEPREPPSETLMMANQDQIQLMTHDFGSFLAKMASFLKLASRYEPGATPRLEEKTLALFTVPSIASWRALRYAWLVNGRQEDEDSGSSVEFLLGFSNLPSHRDPLGTRGALEGFVVVRNDFYQQRIDQIVRSEGVLESSFLRVLPFHQLMTGTRFKLEKLNVVCVDLVLASRSASMLPVVSKLDVEDMTNSENEKLLYIANCAENYADGRLTNETYYLMDGLFSMENAKLIRHEWSCVVFLRFVVEEVVAPRTRVILRGDGKGVSSECGGKSIALLPAELLVESSDEEELLVEEDSDLDDEEDTIRAGELLDASAREALLLQSSYAKRPTLWYSHDASDTYQAKFHERLATVLEECRVVLAGLLLALDEGVRQKVCSDWYLPDSEGQKPEDESSAKDPLHDVALAYALLVLRDGLLALPFFATQQFRWEDDKMLARHMVLQMLLEGGPEAFNAKERPRSTPATSDAVVGVKAIEERVNRDITQLALGIDEIRVKSLEVLIHTETVDKPNQRKRSWRHRLKIHVRGWLQQIQWIQMTGDVASGQRLYERFSLVSDESLRYRHFILLQLGDPDTVRKAGEASGGGLGRPTSKSSDPHFMTGGSSSEPLPHTPTPSMEVRNKLLGIRNPSHFCCNTIWIPPFLELNELGENSDGALRAKKRANSSENAVDDCPVDASEVDDTAEQADDNAEKIEDHEEEATSDVMKQVELRMFHADLSYALEAAVLNIGIITDTEAAAFKMSTA